ncbi:MAG: AAA family ATPase [Rhodopila sp.]
MQANQSVVITTVDGLPEQVHVFSEAEVLAVDTAIAAYRALLVRGEPGIGKTQLAIAAAVALGRGFVSHVVDSRTEARDLLWHFDAVARLAQAQVQGALSGGRTDRVTVERALNIGNFIQPRPIWWAFDWTNALCQAERAGCSPPPQPHRCNPANGMVVLIDEIDKADTDVPNGLLEALGAGEFTAPGIDGPVRRDPAMPPPLVIITTNEDRGLPDPFVRRCLALHLRLPEERRELIEHLVARGKAHFPGMTKPILEHAAEMLADDRAMARHHSWLPLPGQAEYIDLIRVLHTKAAHDATSQQALLDRIRPFILRKHPDAARQASSPPEPAA